MDVNLIGLDIAFFRAGRDGNVRSDILPEDPGMNVGEDLKPWSRPLCEADAAEEDVCADVVYVFVDYWSKWA